MNVDEKTRKYFEDKGYLVGKVECRNGKISRDLFGFIDFVALNPMGPTLAIQATDHTSFSKRLKKVKENPNFERVQEVWNICVIGFKPDQTEPHRLEYL